MADVFRPRPGPDPRAFEGQPSHVYISTACQHLLHDQCRQTCKFCDSPCCCICHDEGKDQYPWTLLTP